MKENGVSNLLFFPLALANFGNTTQLGGFLFVLCHQMWPRQVGWDNHSTEPLTFLPKEKLEGVLF